MTKQSSCGDLHEGLQTSSGPTSLKQYLATKRRLRPLVPIAIALALLLAAQCLFTRAALVRMVYEELAESLRNPYWLSQGTMYDRWSSNVGWYGLLTAVYYAVGYDVYLAKWVRFALHAVSLLALAAVFVRWLGVQRGTATLLVVGLSPTWIYCNTYQTSYGIDLQFVPLLLFLLIVSPVDTRSFVWGPFLFGLLFCFAGLCYPTVLFYLPACLLLVAYRLWTNRRPVHAKAVGWLVASSALGFYLPLGLFLCCLKDPDILMQGMFQGGGAGISWDLHVLREGVRRVLADLFIEPTSYYFDLPQVEFAHWLPFSLFLTTLCGASLFLSAHAINRFQANPYFVGMGLSLFLMVWFLIVPNWIPNEPGIRRSTGLLVGYYGVLSYLLTMLWSKAFPLAVGRWQPVLAWALVLLHLVAHGLTLRRNLAAYPEIAGRRNEPWIMVRENPRDSLAYWFQQSQSGRPIECKKFGPGCRYAVRYASVCAQQVWNGRESFPVTGIDPNTKETRELSLSIWERREWPH